MFTSTFKMAEKLREKDRYIQSMRESIDFLLVEKNKKIKELEAELKVLDERIKTLQQTLAYRTRAKDERIKVLSDSLFGIISSLQVKMSDIEENPALFRKIATYIESEQKDRNEIMSEKTILDYLNELPDALRELALKEVLVGSESAYSIADAIAKAFYWTETKEGHEFWSQVEKFYSGEVDRLPEIPDTEEESSDSISKFNEVNKFLLRGPKGAASRKYIREDGSINDTVVKTYYASIEGVRVDRTDKFFRLFFDSGATDTEVRLTFEEIEELYKWMKDNGN